PTSFSRDWSSDVCSSDLYLPVCRPRLGRDQNRTTSRPSRAHTLATYRASTTAGAGNVAGPARYVEELPHLVRRPACERWHWESRPARLHDRNRGASTRYAARPQPCTRGLRSVAPPSFLPGSPG